MTTGASDSDERAVLQELEELLRLMASGRHPNRSEATRYTTYRATLLAARTPLPLPGFLKQCLSLERFRDFITLFDPAIERRERFVKESFEAARSLLAARTGQPRAIERRSPNPAGWIF